MGRRSIFPVEHSESCHSSTTAIGPNMLLAIWPSTISLSGIFMQVFICYHGVGKERML
uniref:Similar to Os09g0515500 n=1 Tax=Arundo donax TaxID=35708 RepID=A0A0A9DHE3_ARUDO